MHLLKLASKLAAVATVAFVALFANVASAKTHPGGTACNSMANFPMLPPKGSAMSSPLRQSKDEKAKPKIVVCENGII